MSEDQQEVPAPLRELSSLFTAHYRFQYLAAAYESGLFAALAREPGLGRSDLAVRLGLNAQPTRILLLGCTAYGLLRKEDDRYYNTPLAELLTKDADQLPAAFVPYHRHITYRTMGWFYESLREDNNVGLRREFGEESTTLYERISGDAALEPAFHNAMGSFSRLISEELSQSLDLSGHRHLLDVGGGTARNAASFARRWPHLRITILDLPSVAERANARLRELGLDDRVEAVGVDAFEDAYPTGCDGVLFAHFLEIWSPERIRTLLSKAADAVTEGAGLYVITPGQWDDETGPEHAAELSAYFHTVASGEGMVYTPREYEEWMTAAGFTPRQRTALGGEFEDHVVLTGVKSA